ncbi:MAG: glycosyltransferase [Bacteroidota bacterium]|nr:glycosyltransferase [Bacteroidota bacterium]
MTQVLNPDSLGGTMTVFNIYFGSALKESFEIVPLVQSNARLNFKQIRSYYRFIKTINPVLIDVQGVNIEVLSVLIAAKLAGIKIVMGVHGMYSDLYEISKIKKWISAFITEPISFYLADGVYCVCEFATRRKKFNRFTRHMLGYSYNPAPDYSSFDKKYIRNEMRTKFNIDPNIVVGIVISRITYDKGLSFLTEALLKLGKNWPSNFRVFIVGDGRYMQVMKEKLQELIEESLVIMVGFQKEIHKYLFSSDFFISPSLHENHSLSLLEALAAGLPLLATKVGGNPEIVLDGENGKLISSMSSEELKEGIEFMISNKIKFNTMGKRSLEIAQSKYNVNKCVARRKDIYWEMISR